MIAEFVNLTPIQWTGILIVAAVFVAVGFIVATGKDGGR